MRFLGSLNWAQSVALRIEFQSFGVEEEKERMDLDVDDELEGEVGGFGSWFSSAWEEVSEAVVSLESLCGFPGHHGDIALMIGSRVLVMRDPVSCCSGYGDRETYSLWNAVADIL